MDFIRPGRPCENGLIGTCLRLHLRRDHAEDPQNHNRSPAETRKKSPAMSGDRVNVMLSSRLTASCWKSASQLARVFGIVAVLS